MTRFPIAGALYADCAPDGTWAALIPGSHIATSRGIYPLPPGGDLLFLRMTVHQGALLLAGQGHDGGRCWLYDHPQWRDVGPTFGVSPVAFGDGKLFLAIAGDTVRTINLDNGVTWDGPLAIGSQGLRYVADGQPVTGDASFRDGDYFEFTRLGDVTVGQGAAGGAVINGRLLEPGDCRFIRMSRDGDRLAIAMAKLPEHQAVMFWLTVSEIAGLPVYGTPNPEPGTQNPPPPEKPVSAPLETIKAIRAKYPTPLGATHAAFLAEVALALGVDLLRKDSGTYITMPDGVKVSQDIALDAGRIGYDILYAGEAEATPTWNGPVEGSPFPLERVYRVTGKVDTPPTPTAPASIDAQIKALIDAAVKPLRAEIEKLKAQKPPEQSHVSAEQIRNAVNGIAVSFKPQAPDTGHLTAEPGGDVNAKLERQDDGSYKERPFGSYQLFTLETH